MPNTVYSNFIIENKIKNQLKTKLGMLQFATVDDSLALTAGMIKKIHTYSFTGAVEHLTVGNGNTSDIAVSFIERDYEVGVAQGRFPYYDEQAMTDPTAVETGINGVSTAIVNDLTDRIVAELGHATLGQASTAFAYADFCDAMAKFGEEEEGLFILMNPKQTAAVRKALKDDLKYVEAFVRKGYIGSINGAAAYTSAAVPEGVIYIATKEAVTVFTKPTLETETERDANTRKNTVYGRQCNVVALTDATKVVQLGAAQTTTLTATGDISDGTVAGAADTGAVVTVYSKATGKVLGKATAASNTYSISDVDIVSDGEYFVISELAGKINSVKDVTVQA